MDILTVQNVGLFILRAGFSILIIPHGWAKLMMIVGGKSAEFLNPIGIGAPASIWLAMVAELGCGVLLLGGVFARPMAAILTINMAIALFANLKSDSPWESAALFLIAFLSILILGGGDISWDHAMFGKKIGNF